MCVCVCALCSVVDIADVNCPVQSSGTGQVDQRLRSADDDPRRRRSHWLTVGRSAADVLLATYLQQRLFILHYTCISN